MPVLSDRLSTGQITFIFRVVIQALSYGGIFLIGLIILGNTPRTAPLETHDTLNRVVGKSTATTTTLRWIKKQIFNKDHGSKSPRHLLPAFIHSLLYGLFVALSDVGFIGLHTCSVPFSPYTDFPASVRSEADARKLIGSTIVQGTNPSDVKSFRCNSAEIVQLSSNQTTMTKTACPSASGSCPTINSCTSWTNSTYDDPSSFRILNMTDTDALMLQKLGPSHSKSLGENVQTYYFGPLGSIQTQAKITSGVAVLPDEQGVTMLIGAPNLAKHQLVTLPRTMAVELSFGCLPLGIWGVNDPAAVLDRGDSIQYFTPDAIYKPTLQSNFTGPDYLFDPLSNAAEKLRQHVLPTYNTSQLLSNGYYGSLYAPATTSFSWVTEVKAWYPSNDHTADSNDTKVQTDILDECSTRVNQALNITLTPETRSYSCSNVLLTGSYIDPQSSQVFRGYSAMACASATSLTMVSATLEADQDGHITSKTTTLPSDLHEVSADFWQVLYNETSNITLFDSLARGSVQRFTLSENPSGQSTHYILQSYPFSYSSLMLAYGAGSVGYTIPQIGVAAIDPSTSNSGTTTETLINGTFFSCNNFSTAVVTKWAAGLGASYLLSGYALNGFAALDKEPLTVRSTGGKPAVCYQPAYFAAFVPLLAAALLVIVWVVGMLVTSKLRVSKIWEKRYGGLTPTLPQHPATEVLSWEETGEIQRLRPLRESDVSTQGVLSVPYETTMLVPDKESYND